MTFHIKTQKLSKPVSNPLQVNSDKPINTVDYNLLAKNEIPMNGNKYRPKNVTNIISPT